MKIGTILHSIVQTFGKTERRNATRSLSTLFLFRLRVFFMGLTLLGLLLVINLTKYTTKVLSDTLPEDFSFSFNVNATTNATDFGTDRISNLNSVTMRINKTIDIQKSRDREKNPLLCKWWPPSLTHESENNDDDDDEYKDPCVSFLIQQIQSPLSHSTSLNTTIHNANQYRKRRATPQFRRWLFLGDSTMSRMFKSDRLLLKLNTPPCSASTTNTTNVSSTISTFPKTRKELMQSGPYSCKFRGAKQCNMDSLFDGLERVSNWVPPSTTTTTSAISSTKTIRIEGPRRFHTNPPFCTDCVGCTSSVIMRRPKDDHMENARKINKRLCDNASLQGSSGGYVSVEYARDREIQTTRYDTTQANLAHWVRHSWNEPPVLVEELGRPICVISTGIHDQAIPNITKDAYLQNVQDYLDWMAPECSHIIWLSNTSPVSDEYAQTQHQTEEWNQAVLSLLSSASSSSSSSIQPRFRYHASYIDVYESSLQSEHVDNIHMSDHWYKSLNRMFAKVIEGVREF